MEVFVDIKTEKFESAYVHDDFWIGVTQLRGRGYRIISVPELAELRVKQGLEAPICKNQTYANWVREGAIYVPQRGGFFVRTSPILDAKNLREVNSMESHGKDFFLDKEALEQILDGSIPLPVKQLEIPVERLGSDDLAVFVIGGGDSKKAAAYGRLLKRAGLEKWKIYPYDPQYVNKERRPFARQVAFEDIGYGDSNLVCEGLVNIPLAFRGHYFGDGSSDEIRGIIELESKQKEADGARVFENPIEIGPRKIVLHIPGYMNFQPVLLGDFSWEDEKNIYYKKIPEKQKTTLVEALNKSSKWAELITKQLSSTSII